MSNNYEYIPLYNSVIAKQPKNSGGIKLPFEKFSWLTLSLPFSAFIFCVLYSVAYNFESATYSHCNVYNILPSISSAIGNFSPQRNVWQIAIALQALPRFCVAFAYLHYHYEVLFPWAICFSSLACILNVVENIALVILSFWTSAENYPIHKTAFITFILMSEAYMLLIWFLHRRCRRHPKDIEDIKSLKIKRILVIINIFCILIATYFFIRHNTHCEQYVYSFFAFFEYIVVLTNMGFHMTAYLDFKNRYLVVNGWNVTLEYR